MDAATVVSIGIGFIGSAIAQKCADAVLAGAWESLSGRFAEILGRAPAPGDLAVFSRPHFDPRLGGPLAEAANLAFQQTSALRRARREASILAEARILWIDDRPENNAWEAAMLELFGVVVRQESTTEAALELLAEERFDLVVSDIARGDATRAGLDALSTIRLRAPGTPVIFYVGDLRAEMGVPPGAFGITNRPDELLHLVLDALERMRG